MMSRLTKEQLENFRNTFYKYEWIECNAIKKLLDELIEYKALEEELCISLPILFKAIKTNIWNNNTKRQEWVVLDYSNNEFVLKTTKELYIDDSKCILSLKDYGKTWWLKEDLKSE